MSREEAPGCGVPGCDDCPPDARATPQTLDGATGVAFAVALVDRPELEKVDLRPRLEALSDRLCQTQPFVIGALEAAGLTVVRLDISPRTDGPRYFTCVCKGQKHGSGTGCSGTGAEFTGGLCGWCIAECRRTDGPTADPERKYPCADCGLMRTKAEGGTVFTVCDACWDKLTAAIEADRAARTTKERP